MKHLFSALSFFISISLWASPSDYARALKLGRDFASAVNASSTEEVIRMSPQIRKELANRGYGAASILKGLLEGFASEGFYPSFWRVTPKLKRNWATQFCDAALFKEGRRKYERNKARIYRPRTR